MQQYTQQQYFRYLEQNLAYPKPAPITALELRQVLIALGYSIPFLADGGFATKLPTWSLPPPAVANLFAKDAPVVYQGTLYRAKRLVADSRTAPGSYEGWQQDWEALVGGLGGSSTLEETITVSLAGGKTAGALKDADVLEAGLSLDQILSKMLVEPKYPSYQPAQVKISQSAASIGEAGETITNTIVTSFVQNDAGILAALSLKQDGQLLNQQAVSPLQIVKTMQRPLGTIQFQAFADYQAGPKKTVQPAGTPDDRPAKAGSPDAPQAAGVNQASSVLNFTGELAIFYGPTSTTPNSSESVRSLPSKQLTSGSKTIVLNTGTSTATFALWVPQGLVLSLVTDMETNATLTSQYIAQSYLVADAGGTARAGTLYVMRQAVPFTSNHRHEIKLS